ncbi:MAG TPA: acyl-CoA dehydrogenase family protein [Solirubrobacteraceae bacterium]|nr:acyl-CoA dehydrogenase family protein [Solirubrobacteraceae bacterium]
MWRLNDEQERLRDEIREIVIRDIQPRVREMVEDCEYPRDLYEVMARHQLLGLGFPPEHGGRCESETSWCAWIEELAKISGTVSLMAAYVKLTSLPLLLAGSEAQQRRVIPGLISGELLGSFALTEPNVGSDPAGLETRAERHGDVWVLNGEKRFIGNAGLSDVYVVFARTGDAGARGVSAFLVDGHAPGVSVTKLRTMGMPGWQLGAPRFEDVEVPAENLIGREGDGFRIAMATFDRSRPTVAAQAVGLAQGAIDLALDYAVRRRSFGKPLIGHQGIQFKLAEMETRVAAARALAYQAAAAVDDDDPRLTKIASMAKLFASDTAMEVTTQAVQVLGGNGYLRDYPAERMMRDAKVLQIYEGANEIQYLVIARQLAQEAADRDPVWPECMPAEASVGAPA